MNKQTKRHGASKILYNRYIKNDVEMQNLMQEVRDEANIARKIHSLRKAAGLTQSELAAMVGTQTSAISRLEDADYESHSLPMLRKIAKALKVKLKVDFISPNKKEVA